MSSRPPPRSARPACPRRSPHVLRSAADGMARPRLETGGTPEGFRTGPPIHQGGMAVLWEVTHPDHELPLLMKVPRLFEGEDPAAIVGFEMEQMILPRLSGAHVPRFIAAGDFAVQP